MMALKALLEYACVSVKEGSGTSTYPPSLNSLGIRVKEGSGTSNYPPSLNSLGLRVKEEGVITSNLVPVLSTLPRNVKEERAASSTPVPVLSTPPRNVKEERVITSTLVPVLPTLPTHGSFTQRSQGQMGNVQYTQSYGPGNQQNPQANSMNPGQYCSRAVPNHVPHPQFGGYQGWGGPGLNQPPNMMGGSGSQMVAKSGGPQSGVPTQAANTGSGPPPHTPPHYLKQPLQYKMGFSSSVAGMPPSPAGPQGYGRASTAGLGPGPGGGPASHHHSVTGMGPPTYYPGMGPPPPIMGPPPGIAPAQVSGGLDPLPPLAPSVATGAPSPLPNSHHDALMPPPAPPANSHLTPVDVAEPARNNGLSVPTPSIPVIDLTAEEDGCDDDYMVQQNPSNKECVVKDEPLITSPLVQLLEEPLISSPLVPVLAMLATLPANGNGEPQHSTTKQPDASNSIICTKSFHPTLRPVETNRENSIAQQPVCIDSTQMDPLLKQNQTNSESNTAEEPQCLGPFEEFSSIKCPKCPVVLTNNRQLLLHPCIDKYMYRESKKKRSKCCFCKNEYCDRRGLKKHIQNHVRKRYVKCSICLKCFTSESSFKSHALIHTNQWPYHCKICGQGATNENALQIHESIHTKEKSWMCDVCGAMFHNQLRLNSHKTIHSDKKYECNICFRKFRQRIHLKKHKKIHGVREKFHCADCDSALGTKTQLKYHIETKHPVNCAGESFVCSVCDREFNHRTVFKIHMYRHKVRNENVVYTCDMCKRNFATKSSLSRHIAEHNGKQFSCSHCGMLFTQPSSVKRHMLKSHDSEC